MILLKNMMKHVLYFWIFPKDLIKYGTMENVLNSNVMEAYSTFANIICQIDINGKESNWTSLKAGVPQGSVLGPLRFLVYMIDQTDNISSDMSLFAADSSLFTRIQGIELIAS